MTSNHKTGVIVVMWIAAMVMMGVITNNNPEMGAGAVILAIFILLSVIGGTIAISQADTIRENGEQARASGRGKLKNGETALMDRLIDSMNEEELAALRRRLGDGEMRIGDDGEMVQIQRR